MTHEEQDRPTWDGEALAEAIGRELSRFREDLWTDERFLAWLAEETRRRAERRMTASQRESMMLREGQALHARVLARRCAVGIAESLPRVVRAPRRMTPMQATTEAHAAQAAPHVELAPAAGAGRVLWDEPCDHWVMLPPAMAGMRALAMRVEGESMAPLIRSRDTVLVELDTPLVVGRIVVARDVDDGYVCKCVERIGRREIVLGSLNREFGGVVIPRDPRRIVGTVRLVWRS